MRSLRSLFGGSLDRANRLPVAAPVAARVVAARSEVHPAGEVKVARVRDGRPVVAVRTGIFERTSEDIAGAGEEDAVRGVVAPSTHDVTVHAVLRRPRPIAFIRKARQLLIRRHTPSPAPLHMRGVMLRRENAIHRNSSLIL